MERAKEEKPEIKKRFSLLARELRDWHRMSETALRALAEILASVCEEAEDGQA